MVPSHPLQIKFIAFICLFLTASTIAFAQQTTHSPTHTLSNNMSTRKIIFAPEAGQPIGPYSQAVQIGQMVFVSGVIGLDAQTGEIVKSTFEAETHQVMKNMGAILAAAGLTYDQVVKCTIFLADMNQFPIVNEIYGSYFKAGNYPARETVQVSRLPKDARVEISVVAAAE
jgi:2-iminobutanoate/2-iminopropanoate deaminase